MNVFENVAFPLREHMPLSEDAVAERVRKYLDLVELEGVEEQMPSDLSGGMRKRVGLARAIAIEPEVILWDEPTTGLDPISTRIIDDLINSMAERLGCTSIVVTHDMDSAFRVSDRIAMLSQRQIVEVGTVDDMQNSSHPDVRAFFDARKD
jgi:phospholipid/cholesterol/gamma-HCH transport system ATP-binding protein